MMPTLPCHHPSLHHCSLVGLGLLLLVLVLVPVLVLMLVLVLVLPWAPEAMGQGLEVVWLGLCG